MITPSRRAGLRAEIAQAIDATYTDVEVFDAETAADAVLTVLHEGWPWLRADAEDTCPGHRTEETMTDTTDRATLRKLIAGAIHRYDHAHALSGNDIPSQHHYGEADAALAVLPASVAPPSEVWTVGGSDGDAWGLFATEADAKRGMIDYYEEHEDPAPDYRWQPDGPRQELLAGREQTGIYLTREPVHGAPEPADRAAEDAKELADLDREEAELVCVDECGSCDACGFEPFGTPAEGWREAARFLRRTPRDSADFLGAIRGARLIETELRRMADEAQPAPDNDTLDRVREITRRLSAHAAGFQDVLDDSDRGPWGRMVGADIAALREALDAAEPPTIDAAHEAQTGGDQ